MVSSDKSGLESTKKSWKPSERLYRCLQILNLLQTQIGYSLSCLASEFNVSRRTILRDLRFLAEAGESIHYDATKQGYILLSGSRIHTPKLSSEERAAIILAAHLHAFGLKNDDARVIHQAIAKLLSHLPGQDRDQITTVLSSIRQESRSDSPPHGLASFLPMIVKAVGKSLPIRIIYRPCNGADAIRTKVTLDRISFTQGCWFLVGHSSWHRKEYRFDTNNIVHAEVIEELSDAVDRTESPAFQALKQ